MQKLPEERSKPWRYELFVRSVQSVQILRRWLQYLCKTPECVIWQHLDTGSLVAKVRLTPTRTQRKRLSKIRVPEDNINIAISHSGSKGQYERDTRYHVSFYIPCTMLCAIFHYTLYTIYFLIRILITVRWSFGPLCRIPVFM